MRSASYAARTRSRAGPGFFAAGRDRPFPLEVAFVEEHRDEHEVVLICVALEGTDAQSAPPTYYAHRIREPLARAVRAAELTEQTRQVREENLGVCGVRKVWAARGRQGMSVARRTVERLSEIRSESSLSVCR